MIIAISLTGVIIYRTVVFRNLNLVVDNICQSPQTLNHIIMNVDTCLVLVLRVDELLEFLLE